MTPHQNNRQPVTVSDTAAICLQIDALTVLRGQRLVIDQLTHQQNRAELCLLTGANGAEKSTTLKKQKELIRRVGFYGGALRYCFGVYQFEPLRTNSNHFDSIRFEQIRTAPHRTALP